MPRKRSCVRTPPKWLAQGQHSHGVSLSFLEWLGTVAEPQQGQPPDNQSCFWTRPLAFGPYLNYSFHHVVGHSPAQLGPLAGQQPSPTWAWPQRGAHCPGAEVALMPLVPCSWGACWDGPCLTHPRSPYGALILCGNKINIPNFLLLQHKNTASESITFYTATAH